MSFLVVPIVASWMIAIYCWLSPPAPFWKWIIPHGLPSTVLCTVIVTLLLPYMMGTIDNFFQEVAKKKAGVSSSSDEMEEMKKQD